MKQSEKSERKRMTTAILATLVMCGMALTYLIFGAKPMTTDVKYFLMFDFIENMIYAAIPLLGIALIINLFRE